ncbi:metallophosphoesterase [uncultured Erythrobacter sp.]|uniref:metallophosphoesterase family protein n=1 Tax=uncultured Erythrobacter sp. TaxID=263913 RepID=UPI00260AEB51|nr:metallophosphoesterase [uncultured Erythrobacter sp.]
MTTRLFHISDVHFGVEDRAALESVAKAVHEECPDALVCTGDLTQRATKKQYKAAADWFAQFDVPIWIDPGNHDMPYYNLWERFTSPYARYNALRQAVAVDHFETDDVVLLPLKTTVRSQNRWPWSDGYVTPSSQARTEATLKEYDGDPRHLIVTAHHPLHGPKIHGPSDTIYGNEAIAALAQGGMNAVLTGHIHRPFDEHRSGTGWSTHVIGAGTLSTRLRGGNPPSYNVLTCVKGKGIAVEVREFPLS